MFIVSVDKYDNKVVQYINTKRKYMIEYGKKIAPHDLIFTLIQFVDEIYFDLPMVSQNVILIQITITLRVMFIGELGMIKP